MAKKRGKHRQINLPLDESGLVREWKKQAGIALWTFTKKHFPLKRKLSGKDLYVDSDSLINALVLSGTVPNAADIKGFAAPINQRIPAKPHAVNVYGSWKTVSTKRKVGSMGVYERPTTYYGGRHIELGYYGVKDGKTVTAYGLDAHGDALPAYSYDAVTWLCDENAAEVKRILDECFENVFHRQRESA